MQLNFERMGGEELMDVLHQIPFLKEYDLTFEVDEESGAEYVALGGLGIFYPDNAYSEGDNLRVDAMSAFFWNEEGFIYDEQGHGIILLKKRSGAKYGDSYLVYTDSGVYIWSYDSDYKIVITKLKGNLEYRDEFIYLISEDETMKLGHVDRSKLLIVTDPTNLPTKEQWIEANSEDVEKSKQRIIELFEEINQRYGIEFRYTETDSGDFSGIYLDGLPLFVDLQASKSFFGELSSFTYPNIRFTRKMIQSQINSLAGEECVVIEVRNGDDEFTPIAELTIFQNADIQMDGLQLSEPRDNMDSVILSQSEVGELQDKTRLYRDIIKQFKDPITFRKYWDRGYSRHHYREGNHIVNERTGQYMKIDWSTNARILDSEIEITSLSVEGDDDRKIEWKLVKVSKQKSYVVALNSRTDEIVYCKHNTQRFRGRDVVEHITDAGVVKLYQPWGEKVIDNEYLLNQPEFGNLSDEPSLDDSVRLGRFMQVIERLQNRGVNLVGPGQSAVKLNDIYISNIDFWFDQEICMKLKVLSENFPGVVIHNVHYPEGQHRSPYSTVIQVDGEYYQLLKLNNGQIGAEICTNAWHSNPYYRVYYSSHVKVKEKDPSHGEVKPKRGHKSKDDINGTTKQGYQSVEVHQVQAVSAPTILKHSFSIIDEISMINKQLTEVRYSRDGKRVTSIQFGENDIQIELVGTEIKVNRLTLRGNRTQFSYDFDEESGFVNIYKDIPNRPDPLIVVIGFDKNHGLVMID